MGQGVEKSGRSARSVSAAVPLGLGLDSCVVIISLVKPGGVAAHAVQHQRRAQLADVEQPLELGALGVAAAHEPDPHQVLAAGSRNFGNPPNDATRWA